MVHDPALGTKEWQERVENAPFHLFQAVKTIVEMSGGDGWGLIISPQFEQLAELFQKNEDHFTGRYDFDDRITFAAYPEESITFSRDRPDHDEYYEIIVEYRWPFLEDFE